MAQIVLGAVGATAGAFIGGLSGAELGFSAGVLLAGVLFPPKQGVQSIGMLSDLNVSGSAYGAIIPMVWGQGKVPCNIIWAPALTQHVSTSGGKNLSAKPKTKTYTYTFTGDMYVCEGPVGQIRRVWANDILIHNPSGFGGQPITRNITGITQGNNAIVTSPAHGFANGQQVEFFGVTGMTQINNVTGVITSHDTNSFVVNINSIGFSAYSSGGIVQNLTLSSTVPQPAYLTLFLGTETEVPWSVAEAILGVGNVPAYRGVARLGFQNWDLTPYGGRIPTITAEVAPLAGPQVLAASFASAASEQYLQTPSTADLRFDQHDFSFAFWYKINTAPGAYQKIILKGAGLGSGLTDDYGIQITPANQLELFYSYGNYSVRDIGAVNADGNWHLVWGGWGQGTGAFFWSIDGSAVSSAGGAVFGPSSTVQPLQIGGNPNGLAEQFIGSLDAVGLWNRLLTTGEIAQLWNSGAGVKMSSLTGGILTGMAAGWDLDGPSSDFLWHDAINTHNLVPYNGVTVVTGKT